MGAGRSRRATPSLVADDVADLLEEQVFDRLGMLTALRQSRGTARRIGNEIDSRIQKLVDELTP